MDSIKNIMRDEWRDITLGEIYDRLKFMRETRQEIVLKYGDIRDEDLDLFPEVRQARDQNYEFCADYGRIIEQVAPFMEELVSASFVVVHCGTFADVVQWVKNTHRELKYGPYADMIETVCEVQVGENGLLYLSLRTRGLWNGKQRVEDS